MQPRPLKDSDTKVCVWGEVGLMSIGSGVFDPWVSKYRGFPLTRRVAVTTVLHYRADWLSVFRVTWYTDGDV